MCEFTCSQKGTLKRHIKMVHDRIKDIQCPQCAYTCSQKGDLNKHIKQVHDRIKDIQCPQCAYTCSRKSDLNQHIKMVHDKVKDVSCPMCDYVCCTKNHLKTHIKMVHDKIKDVQCPMCEYTCSRKSALKQHIPLCTGELNCSAGEYNVIQALGKLGFVKDVDYFYNQSYVVKYKSLLKWDFRVLYRGLIIFIEYDGKPHTEPVNWSGKMTEEEMQFNFEEYKRKDKIKNDYCEQYGYPLLRIPYTEFNNIDTRVTEFMNGFMV